MPKYVIKILNKLGHPFPSKLRHSPHRLTPKIYGQKVHLTSPEDHSGILSPLETTKIQRIVGSFLYYAMSLDNTIQTIVNKLSVSQASPQGLHVYPSTSKK